MKRSQHWRVKRRSSRFQRPDVLSLKCFDSFETFFEHDADWTTIGVLDSACVKTKSASGCFDDEAQIIIGLFASFRTFTCSFFILKWKIACVHRQIRICGNRVLLCATASFGSCFSLILWFHWHAAGCRICWDWSSEIPSLAQRPTWSQTKTAGKKRKRIEKVAHNGWWHTQLKHETAIY